MTDAEIKGYLRIPYTPGGESMQGFNCWGLLRWITREHFGRNLPAFPIGEDPAELVAAHDFNLATRVYEPVGKPVDGCGVLLRGGEHPHVGVWLENGGGGVLHTIEFSGVLWTPRHSLRAMGYGRATYFKINV